MTTPNQSSEREELRNSLSRLIYLATSPEVSAEDSMSAARAVIVSRQWMQMERERDQAIRERDEARAAVARVEALADEWMRNEDRSADYQDGLADAAEQVRAALSGGAGEQDKAEACSTCDGTGLVDWAPGQIRDLEGDQQPCPDCAPTAAVAVSMAERPSFVRVMGGGR